jgi:molybdate transport system substrate-binding protein
VLAACALLIAAASDLALLQPEFAGAVPGCEIRISFSSSGMLARQIEAGASFDVYLSANRSFVDRLVEAGAVRGTVPYARGRIAVWSKRGLAWRDLGRADRISIANPAHAPYGVAAKEALEHQGLWHKLQGRLVYGENVRQAWQFAETGNVDMTITAWSLVKDRDGELVPEVWHKPIIQAAGIPVRARNPHAARRFLAWLTSAAGQKVLASEGFAPVR